MVGEPVQNAEDHFDFTLPTASGQTYLDLIEMAPLEQVRGSYDRAPKMYKLGDRADAIAAKILEKSADYGAGSSRGVHLLLYTTDFRFDAIGSVADLLVHILHARTHCLRSVVSCDPSSERCLLRKLFPVSAERRQKLESERFLRRITSVVFDLSEGVTMLPKRETRNSTESGEWQDA